MSIKNEVEIVEIVRIEMTDTLWTGLMFGIGFSIGTMTGLSGLLIVMAWMVGK